MFNLLRNGCVLTKKGIYQICFPFFATGRSSDFCHISFKLRLSPNFVSRFNFHFGVNSVSLNISCMALNNSFLGSVEFILSLTLTLLKFKVINSSLKNCHLWKI